MNKPKNQNIVSKKTGEDSLKENAPNAPDPSPARAREIGGYADGPEPTRYGDWEKNGRCTDF